MSVNKLSMARVAVGSLLVGSAPGKKNAPFLNGTTPISPVEVAGIRFVTETVNPGASIAANAHYQTTFTITGLGTSDFVDVLAPAGVEAGLLWNAYFSAANTLTFRLANTTTGSVSTSSRTWGFLFIQLSPDN